MGDDGKVRGRGRISFEALFDSQPTPEQNEKHLEYKSWRKWLATRPLHRTDSTEEYGLWCPLYYVKVVQDIAAQHSHDSHLSRLPQEVLYHATLFTHFKPSSPSLELRDEYLYFANVAAQVGNLRDTAEGLALVIQCYPLLETDKVFFAESFKSLIKAHQATLKFCKPDEQTGEGMKAILRRWRGAAVSQIVDICSRFTQLVEKVMLSFSSWKAQDEDRIFYPLLLADFYCYWARAIDTTEAKERKDWFANEEEWVAQKKKLIGAARMNFESVMQNSFDKLYVKFLSKVLCIGLRYSIFLYEVVEDPEEACEMAKKVFDGGIAQLDHICEESSYPLSSPLQRLRDKLTQWLHGA